MTNDSLNIAGFQFSSSGRIIGKPEVALIRPLVAELGKMEEPLGYSTSCIWEIESRVLSET
jgi:hypothetical protein